MNKFNFSAPNFPISLAVWILIQQATKTQLILIEIVIKKVSEKLIQMFSNYYSVGASFAA